MPETSSIRSAVLVEHRLVTDRHRPMASTADAQHRAVKTVISNVLIAVNTVVKYLTDSVHQLSMLNKRLSSIWG